MRITSIGETLHEGNQALSSVLAGLLPVDFPAVADFDDPNGQLFVLYGINNAVVALSNEITFLAR